MLTADSAKDHIDAKAKMNPTQKGEAACFLPVGSWISLCSLTMGNTIHVIAIEFFNGMAKSRFTHMAGSVQYQNQRSCTVPSLLFFCLLHVKRSTTFHENSVSASSSGSNKRWKAPMISEKTTTQEGKVGQKKDLGESALLDFNVAQFS